MAPPSRQKSRKIPESFCEDLLPRKLAKEIFSKHEWFRTISMHFPKFSAFNTSGKSYSNLKASKTNDQRFPGCDRKSSKASRKLRDRLDYRSGMALVFPWRWTFQPTSCLRKIAPAIHGSRNTSCKFRWTNAREQTFHFNTCVSILGVVATAQWRSCCHHDRLYQSHWSDDHHFPRQHDPKFGHPRLLYPTKTLTTQGGYGCKILAKPAKSWIVSW